MTNRRDFLKQGSLIAGAIAADATWSKARALSPFAPAVAPPAAAMDPATRALLMDALNAAKMAGASYADARIGRYLQNFVSTREQQITGVTDTDSIGAGVRALVDGTWGFAATRTLTSDGVAEAARKAVAMARAMRVAQARPVELAATPAYTDVSWKSAFTIDPWTVPVEQKVDLLLRANAEAMKASSVKFVFSGLFFRKTERNYADTNGSVINQTIVQSWAPFQITAVSSDRTDFQNRGNVTQPMGRGWEYVLAEDLVGNAMKWGEEAAAKLKAKTIAEGRYDIVVHPTNLWLTIHESIGHPTELDRASGYEANYAGTSFVAPPDKKLGILKYGPAFMNIQGDRSQEGALATIGYDDEGVKPDDFLIVRNGIFNDYQTTREQANWLKWWYDKNNRPTRSHGCSYGDSWSSIQFQRMPNVSLLPGDNDVTFEDLIAGTDKGIAIIGDGSFSIDQQRYNGQFGGQVFHEIRGGKIVGQLKDVAYQIQTTDFWNSMDAIGGKKSYQLGGSFFDGKGQPPQVNAVSHGAPAVRFRQANILNTAKNS